MYDLPSVEVLVKYFHAAAGFPVKDTWLKAIKNKNYVSWPGLTYENARKYCPSADDNLKGHLVQTRQGIRSTKPKVQHQSCPEPVSTTNDLHLTVEPISKLYTDDTGCFPTRAQSGNQYIMIAFHTPTNAILVAPFKSRKDFHRMEAYNSIMKRLKYRNHHVDLQILDNEARAEYKTLMTAKWKVNYQMVPTHIHRRNAVERAIQTFKAHFLSVLAGVS